MKAFILTIGTLLISYPLVAQTNFPPTAPVTGAPVLDPGNTAPIPPSTPTTINSNSPVNSTGFETSGTGLGTGSSASPVPPTTQTVPATGTTQPGRSIMGSGWQGI